MLMPIAQQARAGLSSTKQRGLISLGLRRRASLAATAIAKVATCVGELGTAFLRDETTKS